MLNELELFIKKPTVMKNKVKLVGAFQNLPIEMNQRGTTYIFGNAYYAEGARNILSKPLLQIQGFKTTSYCEDPRYPELVTSTLLVSKFGTSVLFKIDGVGKGLVLLAPIEEVLRLQIIPSFDHSRGGVKMIPNTIVAPVVHSIGGGRAGTRSSAHLIPGVTLSGKGEVATTMRSRAKQQLDKDSSGGLTYGSSSGSTSVLTTSNSNNPGASINIINSNQDVSFLDTVIGPIDAGTVDVTKNVRRQSEWPKADIPIQSVFKSLGKVTTNEDKTIKLFYVPSCGRCLTKIEINKYLRVKELHDVAHWGKQRMANLIKGGHLLNCELTSQDVEIYFEIRPACLPCLTNMQMPASLPHVIPTGTLVGTWWEIDVMMWRTYQ